MLLEVKNLKKQYGAVAAVKNVSFQVERGESVGLLGPNGAGKTTTVSMIVGLVTADEGQVLLDGQPITSDTDMRKALIGFVPQDLALYDEMSAQANLELFGALYGLQGTALKDAVQRVLTLVQLADRRGHKVGTFSGGMKRRLNIAAALLHNPKLLLLDEPTVGVDPQSRNAIFDNLEQLRASGVALLYTTHYMEEAERLCDRIVIVDQGTVVANDSLRGLYQRHGASNRLAIELAAAAPGDWLTALRAVNGVMRAELRGQTLNVEVRALADDVPEVLTCVKQHGLTVTHLASERPDLEHVFLSLTGRSLRDP
ncbi:MAG: ABC transporter ATP-binding protein [Myxococcaceae bacterium]|nr:ABC transporter ATP-binding protein [Myxococcaceae bacterium]